MCPETPLSQAKSGSPVSITGSDPTRSRGGSAPSLPTSTRAFIHDIEWHESDGSKDSFDESNRRWKRNGYRVAQVEFRAWDPRRYFFHEPRPPLRKLLPGFRLERVANHESPELRMTGMNQEDSSSHCGVFLIFMATAAEEERAPSGGMGSWLPAIEETSEASSANRRLPYSLSRGVHFENSIV